MALLPGDYLLLGLTGLLALLGLFRGFSGAFAFLSALAVAASAAFFGWTGFLTQINPVWGRAVANILLFILVFGVVRSVVKFCIRKLLAQPSDSIFGICLGLVCGAFLLWGASRLPEMREYSVLARLLAGPEASEEAVDGER